MRIVGRLVTIAGFAAVVAMAPLTASAVVNLTFDDSLKNIQQTENRPCVIGSPSCTQLLDFTKVAPSDNPTPDLTSPTYTVGQLTTLVGSQAMNLLVDVNQTGGSAPADSMTTLLIEVIIDGNVEFLFDGSQVTPTSGSLQGNGFSDAGFKTIDFSSFASNLEVVFHIKWTDADDGAESWFLAPTDAQPVAEPATLALLGSGLVSLAVAARRFRRS